MALDRDTLPERLRHTPPTEKQPVAIFTPLLNVEVALPPTLRFATEMLPENVDVPTPSTFKSAVVVAPPLMVIPVVCVPPPIVDDAVAKILVRNDVPETVIAVEEANGRMDAV